MLNGLWGTATCPDFPEGKPKLLGADSVRGVLAAGSQDEMHGVVKGVELQKEIVETEGVLGGVAQQPRE